MCKKKLQMLLCKQLVFSIFLGTKLYSTESISNELKVKENWLRSYVLRERLKYFGHLKRHDGMGRIILEGKVNGKRKRGRPRRQWEKDVEDVLKMSIAEAGRLANDRDEFRTAVRGATFSLG